MLRRGAASRPGLAISRPTPNTRSTVDREARSRGAHIIPLWYPAQDGTRRTLTKSVTRLSSRRRTSLLVVANPDCRL